MPPHGVHGHVEDALGAESFVSPWHALSHRPLEQRPEHGVKVFGHWENVGGVAETQVIVHLVSEGPVQGHPERLTVL